jgi:hypothetical protein
VRRFRVLSGRPSSCRLLVVVLSLAATGCSDERPQGQNRARARNRPECAAPSSTDTSVALHWTRSTPTSPE